MGIGKGDDSHSLDIIRVDESEVSLPHCDTADDGATQHPGDGRLKENRGGERKLGKKDIPESPRLSKRSKLASKKRKPMPVTWGKRPAHLPTPIAGHSTPQTVPERNLFGFEELDSPLTFSPITTTTTTTPSHSSLTLPSLDTSHLPKPSPYSHLKGTYDIPLRAKTPKKQPSRKKGKRKVLELLCVCVCVCACASDTKVNNVEFYYRALVCRVLVKRTTGWRK